MNYLCILANRMEIQKKIPIPGVEPGPAGWKPAILAVRPYGMI